MGVTAEEKVRKIAPLVEYFESEMGVGAGRLMLATNFLRDAQEMQPDMNPHTRAALEQAEALVVSVMIRLLKAGQEGEDSEGCGCEDGTRTWAQAWINRAKNRS